MGAILVLLILGILIYVVSKSELRKDAKFHLISWLFKIKRSYKQNGESCVLLRQMSVILAKGGFQFN
jgi:hypothetical protein